MHSLIHVVHAQAHGEARRPVVRAHPRAANPPPGRHRVRGHAASALARAAQRLDAEGARRVIA
jgi:hypothetical protein